MATPPVLTKPGAEPDGDWNMVMLFGSGELEYKGNNVKQKWVEYIQLRSFTYIYIYMHTVYLHIQYIYIYIHTYSTYTYIYIYMYTHTYDIDTQK